MMDKISTNVKERILQLLENQGINKDNFFKEIGISYGNFKGKSKNSAPSSDVIAKIYAKFPTVNLEWLIIGTGEMYKSYKSNDNLFIAAENSTKNNEIDFREKYYETLEKLNDCLTDKEKIREEQQKKIPIIKYDDRTELSSKK